MPPLHVVAQIIGGLTACLLIAIGLSWPVAAIAALVGPLVGWFVWRGLRGPRYRDGWP